MALTIAGIGSIVADQIAVPEQTLTNTLNNLGNATQVSPVDLVHLQLDLTTYSVTVNTVSAVAKDFGDTMKGVVNRVS